MPSNHHQPWGKSGGNRKKIYDGKHRFEHWYRDNQVYFITVKTADAFPAFQTPQAKAIFWERFNHYAKLHQFTPFVTSLLTNHYHTLGYLKQGRALPQLMNGVNGSVAKLVNDVLEQRRRPFWHQDRKQTYFDGCIRDETQCHRAYRYVLTQCRRHQICEQPHGYPNTVVNVEMELALKRSSELQAFLYGVGYKRYQRD